MKTSNLNSIIEKTRKGEISRNDAVRIAGVDVRFRFRKNL